MSNITSSTAALGLVLLLSSGLWGCASIEKKTTDPNSENLDEFQPRIQGTLAQLEPVPLAELSNLQLVATDLVSVLLQLPDFQPSTATLQVSKPTTPFGNTVLRALEDAGFGLQRVSADQGQRYVSYRKRFSETDAGPVTDFEIVVGSVLVRREYKIDDRGVFPSSLMFVNGSPVVSSIVLNNDMFQEQGGSGETFVSGVLAPDATSQETDISEVTVNDFDTVPKNRRTSPVTVLTSIRQRHARAQINRDVDLSNYRRLRRTVLIFDDAKTRLMGAGNKQAINLLAREFIASDLFVITACTDVDGRNEAAQSQGIRVEEEFASHGIPLDAIHIAPCVRASFRHPTDNSPAAVTVVQHRRLES